MDKQHLIDKVIEAALSIKEVLSRKTKPDLRLITKEDSPSQEKK